MEDTVDLLTVGCGGTSGKDCTGYEIYTEADFPCTIFLMGNARSLNQD